MKELNKEEKIVFIGSLIFIFITFLIFIYFKETLKNLVYGLFV